MKFAVIAIPGGNGAFRHIYPKVFLPRKKITIALEATARYHPFGWEPPSERKFEYAV
jgi:hypothetical protein